MKIQLFLMSLFIIESLLYNPIDSSRLSVFWINIALNTLSSPNEELLLNKTVWESKLLAALKNKNIMSSSNVHVSEVENLTVVVDDIQKDRSRSYLKLFFYVQQNNVLQPSPAIVHQLNQLSMDWLAVTLGMPLIERPKVYDLEAYEKEDDFMWIIGIIVICFLGILLICWFFVFLYTFIVQASVMYKWLPKPLINNSKEIFYKTDKIQRELNEKKDSEVQTDNLDLSETGSNKSDELVQNKSFCDGIVLDSNPSASPLSTVPEISSEESIDHNVNKLSESVVPLSETHNLIADEQDSIINQTSNDNKTNTKMSNSEVPVEDESDFLEATEMDKTFTFGSFDNVKPLVLSVPPRPEAIKLANLLNSQVITNK
ncbi:hypothetical protein MN116_005270 [Schistosoma mekongi]|uniref:Uncharacterized protein n=1 Tax=Schistosoma mekongi TaxID=38744 RepID=A0AAE1ZDT9_SCHME|nr:hypothetical protein MN116_005270 [Schistosoma mekongi]